MLYHLDTDYLVWSLSHPGPERERLLELAGSDTELEMSAVAWYEFTRGPRTPENVAVASSLLGAVIEFDGTLAELSAELFRRLGAQRRRANDLAIAATALACQAVLLTRNRADFEGVPGLEIESPGE